MARILPFQIDLNALANNANFLNNINHDSLSNVGVNTHLDIDNHISDTTLHFTTIDGLSDVNYTTSPQTGDILIYNSAGPFWEPQEKFYYIDIELTTGTPSTIINVLPSGWSITKNAVGDFTLIHNLGISHFGYALTGVSIGSGLIINPYSINTTDISFYITDTLNNLVDARVVGMLIRR